MKKTLFQTFSNPVGFNLILDISWSEWLRIFVPYWCAVSYLCASYADLAPWVQPRGSQCPAALQPGPLLLQSHSSGAEGSGQVWSHVALGCFTDKKEKEKLLNHPAFWNAAFTTKCFLLKVKAIKVDALNSNSYNKKCCNDKAHKCNLGAI